MDSVSILTFRSDRPCPGQLELLPGCGSRGALVDSVTFRVTKATNADDYDYAEVICTGISPEPDDFDPPDSEDDDISYCFEEDNALRDARAYWRKLVSLGYRHEC